MSSIKHNFEIFEHIVLRLTEVKEAVVQLLRLVEWLKLKMSVRRNVCCIFCITIMLNNRVKDAAAAVKVLSN
jgi:hypothetical protein